jgi:hypothetical protein
VKTALAASRPGRREAVSRGGRRLADGIIVSDGTASTPWLHRATFRSMERVALTLALAVCSVAVISLAGCQDSPDNGGGGQRVTSPAAPSLAAHESALRMRLVTKRSQPTYTEGFVSFLEVRYIEGQIFFRARYPASGGRSTVDIPPGLFRIASFLRPCNGTCARLDPPVDSCSSRFRSPSRRSATVRAHIVVTPTEGCVIRLRR